MPGKVFMGIAIAVVATWMYRRDNGQITGHRTKLPSTKDHRRHHIHDHDHRRHLPEKVVEEEDYYANSVKLEPVRDENLCLEENPVCA
ncbi:hypothetical protein K402DRAFT_416025 [Aulographum hederae CBS 113979]|uniref:Uncharacterized protein n=1 Tax=Aulographum hederae CBS 113979 TaxID=1176131 RepID=A0A6G1HH43_9PEZI|nr:hypothetical protein K402DRAFT_416025 [Aulographum hederae CBS 113979]